MYLMISSLIEALFKIIALIWNAPMWLVLLIIFLIAIVYFFQVLFDNDNDSGSSGSTEYGGTSSRTYADKTSQIKFDKVERSFIFYDSHGDRRGRGDCFYDSKGYRRSWGDGFYDGKGYYRSWGDSYYDALGYFRSWGECFYDTQGNLVYPD